MGGVGGSSQPVLSVQVMGTTSPNLALTHTIALEPCGTGWGLVSPAGKALACGPCGAQEPSGTMSLDPCEPIVECPPGVLAIDQACVPCPENTDRASITS